MLACRRDEIFPLSLRCGQVALPASALLPPRLASRSGDQATTLLRPQICPSFDTVGARHYHCRNRQAALDETERPNTIAKLREKLQSAQGAQFRAPAFPATQSQIVPFRPKTRRVAAVGHWCRSEAAKRSGARTRSCQ